MKNETGFIIMKQSLQPACDELACDELVELVELPAFSNCSVGSTSQKHRKLTRRKSAHPLAS